MPSTVAHQKLNWSAIGDYMRHLRLSDLLSIEALLSPLRQQSLDKPQVIWSGQNPHLPGTGQAAWLSWVAGFDDLTLGVDHFFVWSSTKTTAHCQFIHIMRSG